MIHNRAWQLVYFIVFGLTGFCGIQGCTSQNDKQPIDEKVYSIIEEKWEPDFGSKANYRISDTIASPNNIQFDKEPTDFGILTLPQAVALATARNREYQTQKDDLYIKALDLGLSRHAFEYQFFGGASTGYNADRNDEVVGIETKLGFNRLLAGGTRISTELALAWVDVLTGNMRSGLTSILSVAVTQPLLRGSDRRVVLENLTQAERDTLYQIRSFNRFRQVFVVSVVSQYYRVLQRFDILKNAERNYITLDWFCERVEDLADAGRLPLLEFDQVRQERLQAVNTYSLAEKEYQQALDEFKITLSLPATTEIQLNQDEFEALKEAQMAKLDYSEDQTVEDSLRQRLDVANSADAVIDAERKVFVAADGLRADLNLVGTTSVISSRRADRRSVDWLREEYGIGIEFDLPLDRVAEQNVHRKALITLSQRQREYEQVTDLVTLEVRQAYRDFTEAAERYKVSLEAFNLAQSRFDNTFTLLQYGKASSRRVLSAQNDLFETHNDMVQALLDYRIATLNFYRDTGAIQVLPDGMWKL
ncbi:TolC family protein [Planctomycetota bacterium]